MKLTMKLAPWRSQAPGDIYHQIRMWSFQYKKPARRPDALVNIL